MTKRHFIALADSLKATRPSEQDINMQTGEYAQWQRDVKAIADACCDANSRFNFHLWMSYINGECGPSGGKIK